MLKWLIIIIFSYNAHANDINRNVLILWDSAEQESSNFVFSLSHSKLEVILNHYGLIAEYIDINKKIPEQYFKRKQLKKYIGLITWFTEQGSKFPDQLIKLHNTWQTLNRKTIILGYFGFLTNHNSKSTPISKVNQLLKKWNISISGDEFQNPLVLAVNKKTKVVENERKLENELSRAIVVKSLSKRNKSHLILKNKINNKQTHIVLENNNLFFAYYGYELYQSPYNSVTQWRVDPNYIVKWLIQRVTPIPDTTTLFGKRIMYSHIDGDAFISISDIDRKSYCGEIIKEQIINKYKIPISASLIMAEIDEKYRGNKRIFKIAQDFYHSPYIEPASHTYFHPLSWEEKPSANDIEIYYGEEKEKYQGGPIVAYKYASYEKLDYQKEILGSLNFLNKNILKNEKTNILFWSGSCRPTDKAMKIVTDNNILNINGGDSRFDTRYNSRSHLFPLGKKTDKYLQVYSSNSNENTYTNLWKGPFMGFQDVIETFQNTERPIRYKPINIYFHFYSGERISSLKALKRVFNWSLQQDIIPIYISEFIKIAKNFYEIKIKQTNKSSFIINDIKDLKSLRIDKITYPNYQKSKNIIGHRHINNSTYIFLNNNKSAKLVLSDNRIPASFPIISSSDGHITNLVSKTNKISFTYKSFYGKKLIIDTNGLHLKPNINIKNIKYKHNLAYIELKNKNAHIALEVHE